MPRHPIDLKLSGTATAAGTITLSTGSFAPDGLLCLQRAAVRCTENASLVCHVSFERAGAKLYLETLTTTEGDEIAPKQGPVYAPSDYGVCFEFSSLDAADLAEAFVYGYWTSFPE